MLTATTTAACKVCGATFSPWNSMQTVCGIPCARRIPVINRKAEKAERQEHRRKLEALKTRGDWIKDAQAAFNAWIRARDAGLPCISCGRMHEGSWDAGHYLTTGARPELRFEEMNAARQCVPCNRHLHGNLILYRRNLIERIGREAVEWLEGPHEPRKYTIDDLRAIKAEYRERLKGMPK